MHQNANFLKKSVRLIILFEWISLIFLILCIQLKIVLFFIFYVIFYNILFNFEFNFFPSIDIYNFIVLYSTGILNKTLTNPFIIIFPFKTTFHRFTFIKKPLFLFPINLPYETNQLYQLFTTFLSLIFFNNN